MSARPAPAGRSQRSPPSSPPPLAAAGPRRPGGALDPAFGGDGRATVDFAGSRDTALGLGLRGGRVVLAGSSDIQVAVARLLG